MMPWRRRLRRLRRFVAYGGAVVLILWAVLVALANELLPWVTRHPEHVAAWLSERAGRPIHFQTSSAYWTRSGPVFVLRELSVGEGEDSLRVGDAELLLRVYSGLMPGNPMTELRLAGTHIELVRDEQRRWRATGVGAGGGSGLAQLEALGELSLSDASLSVIDAAQDRRLDLVGIAVRLRSSGGRLRAAAVVPLGTGQPLRIAGEFDPDSGDGRLHAGVRGLSLAADDAGLGLGGLALNVAGGAFDAWLDVRGGELDSLRVEANLSPLALRGEQPLQLDGLAIEPRAAVDGLGISAAWTAGPDGHWSLQVPRLRLQDNEREEAYDGLRLDADGQGIRLSAERLPLGFLAALASLSDRLPPALRGRLYAASPRGALEHVALARAVDGTLRGHARLAGVAFRGERRYPGLEGVSGQLRGDASGWVLDFDAGRDVGVDWPGGLRQREVWRLGGSLVAYPGADGWHLAAPLRIEGDALSIDLAGGVFLPRDGSAQLDLAARVGALPIVEAKRYWLVNWMPPRTVAWLDRALLDGALLGGRAAVVGDVGDWPFAQEQGRFQALAQVADVDLDYHADWPPAEAIDAEVLFQNRSIQSERLEGTVLGLRARVRSGGIADFRNAGLRLDVTGAGSGPDLLAFLRASPLQRRFAAHMAGLSVGGEGEVGVRFYAPLKPEAGEPELEGEVDLRAADLREARWRLAFDQASGRIRFNRGGFAADSLSVRVDGHVAQLDLAMGDYTADPALVVTAALRGNLPVQSLMQRVEGLDWLRPRLEGAADWQIELGVPAEADSPLALHVRSELVGVGLDLPPPMHKPPEEALGLALDLQFPLDRGRLSLRLGERMHLLGRWPAQAPFQGDLLLGPGDAQASNQVGLRIHGTAPQLDAMPWIALGLGGEGGGGFQLDALDVEVADLLLLGRRFTATRIGLDRADPQAWRVRFAGEALQGELGVPAALGPEHPLRGRFARLHWPGVEPGSEAALDFVVPSSLPPIDLQVEDLRYGDARLGSATLETYPTLEGMHIERFETRSPDLAIDARGDWNRIEGRERSSFGIGFKGEDLGRLLAALGYDVRVDRGRTEASIEATWPGAPGAFELERLDGTLRLKVEDGRFLDVEPGAGRILGLFSVNEIARRLSLDFRDFFETGLTFRSVEGSFVLDGGNAFTEDLDIDSPSATIRIRGRTGLAARDYDQTVEVLPRTGGVLPMVGALAGGPAGAALGAVAQSVLQMPLGQMTRTLYRLSGSWTEPSTDVLERGPARRGARDARAAAESDVDSAEPDHPPEPESRPERWPRSSP